MAGNGDVEYMCLCGLPDHPGVGPAADSAVQPHTLLLPHSVGARFNHKLRGVHQTVFVHALEVFLVLMDLNIADFSTFVTNKYLNQTKHCYVNRYLHYMPEAKILQQNPCLFLFYTCRTHCMHFLHVLQVFVFSLQPMNSQSGGVAVRSPDHNMTTPLGHCFCLQKSNLLRNLSPTSKTVWQRTDKCSKGGNCGFYEDC